MHRQLLHNASLARISLPAAVRNALENTKMMVPGLNTD